MPECVRVVAEKPFHVTWQLPGYPGAKLVACGADMAALHCWPQEADRILVYSKVELTACYESKEERGRYHFASTTRYLSVDINAEQSIELRNMIKANLAVGPACVLVWGQEQRNEVQVDGVIRLVVPTVVGQQQRTRIEMAEDEPNLASSETMIEDKAEPCLQPAQIQTATPTEFRISADTPQKKSPLPSYTEPPSVEPLSRSTVTRAGPWPPSPEPPPAAPKRVPFFPHGAESIPPVIWTMPERG